MSAGIKSSGADEISVTIQVGTDVLDDDDLAGFLHIKERPNRQNDRRVERRMTNRTKSPLRDRDDSRVGRHYLSLPIPSAVYELKIHSSSIVHLGLDHSSSPPIAVFSLARSSSHRSGC